MTRHDDGFTLVELLVSITLSTLLGGMVLTAIVQSFGVVGEATDRVEALTSLQQIQERISRVVRAADPISAATPTTLAFTTFREVPACPGPPRSDACTQRRLHTYTRTAGTLTQTVRLFVPASSATPVSTTTTTMSAQLDPAVPVTFTYYDRFGAQIDGSLPSNITEVEISLAHLLTDRPSVVLSTGAQIRNRGIAP